MALPDTGSSEQDIVLPVPLAFVVCDRIIHDQRSSQRSLIGLTNVISAIRFPAMHPSLAIYVALTGGRGRLKCEFRIVEQGQTKPMVVLPGELDCGPGGQELVELDLTLQGLQFTHPAKFMVQFWAHGQFVADRVLSVQQVQVPPQQTTSGGGPGGGGAVGQLPQGPRADPDMVLRFPPAKPNG